MEDQKRMEETPTISINMDIRCSKCGDKGATEGGLCLTCVTKRITGDFEFEAARDAFAQAVEIPEPESFLYDFQPDERLRDLASVLIEHCKELSFIADFSVLYLWKQLGGKSKGRATLGKCIKTSGLTKYFAKTDYIVWLAGDYLYELSLRRKPVNLSALLYHELRHISRDENGQPTVRGHEFEGFASEIERFGVWREDMRPIACAFQESLFPSDQA